MVENVLNEIEFLVSPRDFLEKEISLQPKAIIALNDAAKILKANSSGQYQLVLTRGYVYWGRWRSFCGEIAKLIFCLLYWSDRSASESLFGHNGHNDGLSVDVLIYDVLLNKKMRWLSWRNIIISRAQAEKIIQVNRKEINMLDEAMNKANFTAHSDPREKLQMHYRLNCIPDKNAQKLTSLPKNLGRVIN